MAKKDKHSKRGKLYGKYCTVAVYNSKCKCPTPNDYRKNTDQPWGNPFQAHHLVPIQCADGLLALDQKLRPKIENTPWCNNNTGNMYAMPVWGHTVKHYCRKTKRFNTKRPGFENIPQHSNDHQLYNDEISGALEIEIEDLDGHEVSESTILAVLKSTSSRAKTTLKTRGQGTHNSWMAALEASERGEEHPQWFCPFSMAANPTERSFPIKGQSNDIYGWIDAISNAMSKF